MRYTAAMQRPRDLEELERLREERVSRREKWAAADGFEAQARSFQRLSKSLGGVAELWESLCPRELIGHTAIEALNRGVLTIRVPDASDRFTLDRILRTGVEQELIRRAPMTIRRVKLAVGPLSTSSQDSRR